MALSLVLAVTACGSGNAPVGSLPHSPSDLKSVSADIKLSGAVAGHLDHVRALDCSVHGTDLKYFQASMLFEIGSQWYTIELTSNLPVAHDGTVGHQGYPGPGLYTADLRMRDLVVGAGGVATAGHVWWGWDPFATMLIDPQERTVTIGGGREDPQRISAVRFAAETTLAPGKEGVVGPTGQPPDPNEAINVSGAWFCR